MNKIIVLFKTHLDIGFTDMAQNVVDHYMCNYLPNAMRIARQMRGEKERFIWTTGSWLIDKFLKESPERELLEEAVREGDIRWHGLPFTTHTELMDEELFRYGIGISEGLDKQFGMHTIAAKMTDVPGHTRAMIPHLVQAGIRFLHIGINPASKRPDVPALFWWKAVTGEKILVMYHDDYGELTPVGSGGAAVCFAHTGDNRGPQSAEEIREIYRSLHQKYPEGVICAGTLEDLAKEALMQEGLPVIDAEIGDTWIHGAGTDPRKISQFRSLLRLKDIVPETTETPAADSFGREDMEKMYQELLLVPEHTWGLSEVTWLGNTREAGYLEGEYTSFPKEEFRKARPMEKYRHMEASWMEQREYVNRAAASFSGEKKRVVMDALAEYRRQPWNVEGYEKLYEAGAQGEDSRLAASGKGIQTIGNCPGRIAVECKVGGYNAAVDVHGALCSLTKDGICLADETHLLGAFSYEAFSRNEYREFMSRYVTLDVDWSREDFDKIGMEKAISHHQEYWPKVREIYRLDNILVITMQLPEDAVSLYGGMKKLEMVIQFAADRISFDFAWWEKEATRVAEASWIAFCPPEKVTAVHKMGAWIRPDQVVKYGNRRMHAVDDGVRFETLSLRTLDAPVVSIGERAVLKFPDTLPSLDQGVYCNLYNNVWGTNFPMWYDEDARFRFELKTNI